MVNFDENTIKKLESSKVKISDKLYLVARQIEEKYGLLSQPNHWDDVFDPFDKVDKIFYKVWLWLCYAEWENLITPVSEFVIVFGIEKREKLLSYLENDQNELDGLASYYTLDGEAGKRLLNWGLEKLLKTI